MGRGRPAPAFVLAASLLLGCRHADGTAAPPRQPPRTLSASSDPAAIMEYRGQNIRLTKRYDDYDVYKNDPDNIAPEEHARVQALVKGAPVPEHCADLKEVFEVASQLEFPGYGTTSFGVKNLDGGGTTIAQSIEIPHAGANRYVVYESDGSGYRLADDFVLPEPPYVDRVDIREGALLYIDSHGKVVARRPLRSAEPREVNPTPTPPRSPGAPRPLGP